MKDENGTGTERMTERHTQTQTQPQGVGGRHRNTPQPTEGGGYLDIYTKIGAPDPRLAELADMGLSSNWLRVAAAIGVDAFLETWRILDEVNQNSDRDSSRLRMRMPLFIQYLKYQRNKVVYSLSEAGLTPKEIKKKIKRDLGEDLSEIYISKLIYTRKNKLKKQ